MKVVGSGLGDDVDDAAGGAAELRVGPAGDDLKFLDGFKGDVNRGSLAAHLLAEETVVIVATVETDVVEDAALAVDVDFVAVRALNDAHAGGQREEIFKFPAENRSAVDGQLVNR